MHVIQYIPVEKMAQFHTILCRTGGRYLCRPRLTWLTFEVHYEPGDYEAQCEAWARYITPTDKENHNQWWRVLLRWCGIEV